MDFWRLQEVLKQIQATSDAAECHGTLCGLLCANKETTEYTWLSSLLDGEDLSDQSNHASKRLLLGFFHETVEHLSDPELTFSPLLPDDDTQLHERVISLGEWCAGFVYGLSLGGIEDFSKLPADSSEIIQDIIDIARVDKIEEQDESSENDYLELKEYVRMGVVLIHEELHPVPPEPEHRVLH